LEKNHYLSLGGTAPLAMLAFLYSHTAVTHISLCLDNDVAGLTGMEKIREAVQSDEELSKRIQVMADKAQLKMHIINYSKTRDTYKEYTKSRYKKEYYAAHADEIEKHQAAKAAFDTLGGKPVPKVAQLSKEYVELLSEKKACYEECSLFLSLEKICGILVCPHRNAVLKRDRLAYLQNRFAEDSLLVWQKKYLLSRYSGI